MTASTLPASGLRSPAAARVASEDGGQDRRPRATADLPPSNTVRWVVRRKAQVVAAVQDGLITMEEVCSRYALSVEEFLAWERGLQRHGVNGLRARIRQQT